MCVCDFNTVANIEPAVLKIYDCEVGTDVELVNENGQKRFLDTNSGEEIQCPAGFRSLSMKRKVRCSKACQ